MTEKIGNRGNEHTRRARQGGDRSKRGGRQGGGEKKWNFSRPLSRRADAVEPEKVLELKEKRTSSGLDLEIAGVVVHEERELEGMRGRKLKNTTSMRERDTLYQRVGNNRLHRVQGFEGPLATAWEVTRLSLRPAGHQEGGRLETRGKSLPFSREVAKM